MLLFFQTCCQILLAKRFTKNQSLIRNKRAGDNYLYQICMMMPSKTSKQDTYEEDRE